MIDVLALGCIPGWIVRKRIFRSMLWESFDERVRTAISRAHLRGELACWPPVERLGSSVFRCMVVTGLGALPQAGASSDDPGKTNKPASDASAVVISGRVTDEAGAPLADVRVSVVAVGDPETRTVNASAQSKQPVVRSDARGDYRLEVPGIKKRAIILIDAVKPGFRSLSGPLMARDDTKRFEVVPGTHAEAALVLKPLYFAGVVVDEFREADRACRLRSNT